MRVVPEVAEYGEAHQIAGLVLDDEVKGAAMQITLELPEDIV